MKLSVGMVISSKKAPEVYNEVVRKYVKDSKTMIDFAQFSINDDEKIVTFSENEINYMLRRGLAFVVNNWKSRESLKKETF